jgi:hypothetical protein
MSFLFFGMPSFNCFASKEKEEGKAGLVATWLHQIRSLTTRTSLADGDNCEKCKDDERCESVGYIAIDTVHK